MSGKAFMEETVNGIKRTKGIVEELRKRWEGSEEGS